MNRDELYALLPAVYRVRDEEQGHPLRELIGVIATQLAIVDESLDRYYDDQFVETCAEWIAPYIGDLVGYRPLHGVVPKVASPRAEVANTIRYRRRKGTAAMLEQLALDVTGWPARAVEFFERLTGTQYMNHVRPGRGGTVDLRHTAALEWIGGAFDDLPHTADVRRIETGRGRHNIPNVGIFLWRVAAVPLHRSPLSVVDGTRRRFRFDPLGTDQPLYGEPRTEDEISHLAEPFDVPIPLSRRWLAAHAADYYGPDRSLLVELDGASMPANVRICDLSDVPGGWAHEPAAGSDTIGIDPVLGRVVFADPVPATATPVGTYHYGSALEVGGGGYDRGDPPVPDVAPVAVTGGASLQAALDAVAGGGIVEVQDSWRYAETPTFSPDPGAHLTLRSTNRDRPLVVASAPIALDGGPGSTVVLDGLLIAGAPLVLAAQPDADVRHLVLRHCTLVPGLTRTPDGEPGSPGAASLRLLHPFASVTIERCVLGPIEAVAGVNVSIVDSVVDAGARNRPAFGDKGELTLNECTVIGRVTATQVEISNSLVVADSVEVERRQVGCVRFSYVPPGSRLPRRYRDQPTQPWHRPHFTSLRYGDPGYAQLRVSTPDAIRRGADDEGEMGVTHYLHQPQRETNLRVRLDEYLRFGLEAGFIYAS